MDLETLRLELEAIGDLSSEAARMATRPKARRAFERLARVANAPWERVAAHVSPLLESADERKR
jgi:hypothetical protein